MISEPSVKTASHVSDSGEANSVDVAANEAFEGEAGEIAEAVQEHRPAEPTGFSAAPSIPREENEFDYRPVAVLAPVSLFLGLASSLILFGLIGAAVCILGIVTGSICLWQIRRSCGELGGRTLGRIGLGLSVLFLVSGSALHAYTFATEVPEGYQRVSFNNDIAKKGFVVQNGVAGLHPDVQQLEEKKVFLKGYMYPTGEEEGITAFILCKDNLECCFGGQPKLTDMILVELQDGQTIDYTQSLVAVAGVFRTNPASGVAGQNPVYQIDGVQAGRAKTSF